MPRTELIVFLVFSGITFLTKFYHEPWFDESHAWLLVRENSLLELLFSVLRFEGHPSLWYLILYPFAHLDFPVFSMQIISGLITCAGVGLLLSFEGLPLVIRILLPFTYYIGYQYNIVARSYVLVPILVILCANAWTTRFGKKAKFYLPHILLLHTSVFTALISIMLVGYRFFEFNPLTKFQPKVICKQIFSFWNIIFILNLAFIFIQLYPPANGTFAVNWHFDLERLINNIWRPLVSSLTEEPVSAVLILLVSCYWFHQQKVLIPFLLSVSAVLLLFECKKFSAWHEGIPFLVWLGTWLVFFKLEYRQQHIDGMPPRKIFMTATQLLPLLMVIGTQLNWTFSSVRNDILKPFSGSQELANYISTQIKADNSIYADKHFAIEAILPYFDTCIYSNWNHNRCFWMWSHPNAFEMPRAQSTTQNAEYIVTSLKFRSVKEVLKKYKDYKIEQAFPGKMFWKDRIYEDDSYLLLVHKSKKTYFSKTR